MNPPNPALPRRLLLGGIAVLALLAGGFLLWRHLQTSVSNEEAAAFLDKTVGGGQLRFTVQSVETLRQEAGGPELTVTARALPIRPLYMRADAAEYLHRNFRLDPAATAEARRLLAEPGAPEKAEYREAAPFPADPYRDTLLQVTTPADAPLNFQCIIDAHREGGVWTFALVSGAFEGATPRGEPRSTFGDSTFVAGDAADDARLRAQADDLQAFAERVARMQRDAELARLAAAGGRHQAFLAQIAPGQVFRGLAVEAGEQNGTPLYLEFTGLGADKSVTLLLHNESSWHNARAFQGSWSADDDFQSPTINVSSGADQAIRNAGPFLENTQNWTFALRLDAQGSLTEQNRFFRYRFVPLTGEQVAAIKERLEAEFDRAVAASEPGALFQGTAEARASGTSEAVLLRFTGRSAGGRAIEAVLEAPGQPWKRPLHGSIIDNARRSGGEPLRLSSAANEAVEDAPATSVWGVQDDLELSLGSRAGSLAGEDGHFTYRLTAVRESDLSRLQAAGADRARHFRELVRDGISYDGNFREEQGFVNHSRLEIRHVDGKTGAIVASIHSLGRPNVFRDFIGTCDPAASSFSLSATTRGAYGSDDSFDVPFLKNPAGATLHLTVSGTSFTGRIEGDPHWKFEFSANAFVSVPTESPEPDAPPANGSVFPAFPKLAGAYLLSKGAWTPLPRNNGHVVVETIKPESDLQLPTNILDAAAMGVDLLSKQKEKKKIPYLEFDGKEPRPVTSGAAMVLLFVGPTPPGNPPLELAPTATGKDGRRQLQVMAPPPAAIRLGEQRVSVYLRQPEPGYLLLTTTSTLTNGPYAFNADAGYELTQE
jgi:hypothetical protein